MNSPSLRRWRRRGYAITLAGFLISPVLCPAADTYWSNSGGGNYTNTANWVGGTVPGTADNANFTNNASYSITWTTDVTNSNAFFNAQSGTVTLNASPQTWSLLDQLVVGQLGATASVSHTTGTIVITNAAGLGTLVVGEAGRGTYTLAGGTVIADRLLATNVTAAGTNSIFLFNGGTLTTLGSSEVRTSISQDGVGTIVIGSTATPAVWNILGGSNTINTVALKLGRLSDGHRILVSGTNTVLDYTGSNFQIGEVGSRNQMVISNGARVNMTLSGSGAFIGMSSTAKSNVVTVTGSNSLWNLPAAVIGLGRGTGQDQLIIVNGGVVQSGGAQIGVLAHSNAVTVSGPGSRWTLTGTMLIGFSGGTNSFAITDGGAVVSSVETRVGSSASSLANRLIISGTDSVLQTPVLYVGSNSTSKGSGIVIVEDGGTLEGGLVSGRLVGGIPSGVISNNGGVYQFTINDPNVTTNSANSIVLYNGTISYRGINNAPVFGNVTGTRLTNMAFFGDNAFRLNSASNATGVASYNFRPGLGATNYAHLQLAGTGSLWRSTELTIGPGGSLSGNGTVASANVTNLGTIAPGFSAGLVTFTNNLVLEPSSTLQMEIGGTNALDYDRLIVGGNLSITGALQLTTLNGFSAPTGTVFTLIDNTGASSTTIGQFNGLTNGAFVDASTSFFHIWYDGGADFKDVVLIATIPEPSALALVTVAVYALLRRRTNRG